MWQTQNTYDLQLKDVDSADNPIHSNVILHLVRSCLVCSLLDGQFKYLSTIMSSFDLYLFIYFFIFQEMALQ